MKLLIGTITVSCCLILGALGVTFAQGANTAVTSYKENGPWGDTVTIPKEIAGKPYSITRGSQPGTYTVKWGDDSVVWQPKAFYEETLKNEGPGFYAKWAQKGMPYPWDVPLEKRAGLSADDLYDRCIAWNYYGSYYKGGADVWNNLVVKPDGSLRETEHFLELYQAYVGDKNQNFLTPDERPKVSHKYMWIAVDPEEVRGQSGVTTDFYARDEHPQDTWYTPTVRKVRRLAGSVSKQFFPTTILRYEDVSHVRALPDLNYKVIGFQLWKAGPGMHGFEPNDYPEAKRTDGAGEPVAIIDIKPKPGVNWWYGERKFWCGLESLAFVHSEEFDQAGQPIRQIDRSMITGSEGKMPNGQPGPDWYVTWGAEFVTDKKSGFRGDMWLSDLQIDPDWPQNMFSNDWLVREPRKLGFWR